MKNCNMLIILFVLGFLHGCVNEEDTGSADFSLAPELTKSPTFDTYSISAGESFTADISSSGELINWDVHLASGDLLSPFRQKSNDGDYQVISDTNCSVNSDIHYPIIELTNSNGSTTYSPVLNSSPVYYEITKTVNTPVYGVKTETTALLAPQLEITQSADVNEKSNLTVSIEDVTVNQSTITVHYLMQNLGARAATNVGINIWSNLLQPPTENETQEYFEYYDVSLCIHAGEAIRSSVVVRKLDNSGTVYARIHYLNPDEESDVTDNISTAYSW